jgi:hypothetical protein
VPCVEQRAHRRGISLGDLAVVKYVARTPVSANSSSRRGAPCSMPRKVELR